MLALGQAVKILTNGKEGKVGAIYADGNGISYKVGYKVQWKHSIEEYGTWFHPDELSEIKEVTLGP